MPNGFAGKSSEKYLSMTNEALIKAQEVHNRNPFDAVGSSSGAQLPTLPSRNNVNISHNSQSDGLNGSYSVGAGNEKNIVVDEDSYNDILRQIRQTDAHIAQCLYDVAVKLEEICTNDYNILATVPKFLRIVERAKAALEEFQELSESAETTSRNFVNEIVKIDRA